MIHSRDNLCHVLIVSAVFEESLSKSNMSINQIIIFLSLILVLTEILLIEIHGLITSNFRDISSSVINIKIVIAQ